MKKRTLITIIAVLLALAIGAGIYFATRPKVEETPAEPAAETVEETPAETAEEKPAEEPAEEKPAEQPAAAVEEITILYPGEETDEMSNFLKGAFAEKVLAELNMKVNFRFLSWDAYWDQKSVMLGAQEPIDLYWDGLPDLSTMVNKKEAQPLDDLIAKCWPESMKNVIPDSQMAGGKIGGVQYGIPSAYAPSSAMFQFVCLRQDVLEKVGMTEVKTADDLRTFAEKVQKELPEFKGPADIIFKPLTRNFADEQYTWVASQDLVVFGEESKKAYSYAHSGTTSATAACRPACTCGSKAPWARKTRSAAA